MDLENRSRWSMISCLLCAWIRGRVPVWYPVNKANFRDIASPVPGDIGQGWASDCQNPFWYQGGNIFNLSQCLLKVSHWCKFGRSGISDDTVMSSRSIGVISEDNVIPAVFLPLDWFVCNVRDVSVFRIQKTETKSPRMIVWKEVELWCGVFLGIAIVKQSVRISRSSQIGIARPEFNREVVHVKQWRFFLRKLAIQFMELRTKRTGCR